MPRDVLAGQQAGDRDGAAEESVRDGRHPRDRPGDRGHETLEPRRVQRAAHERDVERAARRAPATQRARNAVLEAPHEADAVLRHREALVGVRLGQRRPRLEIHLVAEKHEAAAEARGKLRLPRRHRAHECLRLLLGQRAQRGQPLAVAREPHGHDRGRRHVRIERRQLAHGPLEVGAVVEAGTEDHLRVHADPRLRKALQPRQDLGRHARAAEQLPAQRGIGRVHRHVERRQPLLDDARELRLLQVGERDVVAVQERQPEVIVLDVESLAHPLRQLVDEAEHALVGAGGDLPGPRRLQLEAELVARPPRQSQRARAALALHGELKPRLGAVELEVDGVAQRPPVDREDAIAGRQSRRGGGRARPHRRHHDALSGRARFHPVLEPRRRGRR